MSSTSSGTKRQSTRLGGKGAFVATLDFDEHWIVTRLQKVKS